MEKLRKKKVYTKIGVTLFFKQVKKADNKI